MSLQRYGGDSALSPQLPTPPQPQPAPRSWCVVMAWTHSSGGGRPAAHEPWLWQPRSQTRRGTLGREAERALPRTLLRASAAPLQPQATLGTLSLPPRSQPIFLTSYLVNELEQQNGGDGFGPTSPHFWQRPSYLEAGVAKSSLVCSGTGPAPFTSAWLDNLHSPKPSPSSPLGSHVHIA